MVASLTWNPHSAACARMLKLTETSSMQSQLLDIFHRRHACHLFQADRILSSDDLDFIIEAGRLSPSSFGLEPWRFIVLTSAHHRMSMQAACFQQPQVGTASAIIVVLAKLSDMDPDSSYLRRLMAREYPGDALEGALKNYRNFHAATDVKAWTDNQCHIAAANMMTAAAGIGIDSCAIGGFDPIEVMRILQIDIATQHPSLILALGYCAQEAGEKLRLPKEELVEYR
jgi:nitroreductase